MKTIICLFFFVHILGAQELKLEATKVLDVDRFIGVDSYKHLYFIKDGALQKQGELGEFVFQDFQLGPVTSVDIINPLNIVVFYAEVNTVVFLDNRLSEKERINFNNLPSFLNVGSATNAGNNNLWLFNVDTQQLQLFNYRTSRQTIFSQPYPGEIIAQTSDFNDCLLLTEDHLYRINIYGSLLSEIPIDGYQKVVRYGKNIIGLKDNTLYFIQDETLIPLVTNFNENTVKDLQLTQEFLYIYHGNVLSTFTLTQPKQ
ncbi:MAG: hypothetical protein AAF489_08930 [Bacteroidota bacterium]